MNEQLTEKIEQALEATNGQDWDNFDGNNFSNNVYEYNRLTEETCAVIAECSSRELAHLIANAPEWLRALLEEVSHWKQCFLDANADWARTGNELGDVKTELEQTREELEYRGRNENKAIEEMVFALSQVNALQAELEQVKAELQRIKKGDGQIE